MSKKLKIMMIGAHLDDNDFCGGGTALKYLAASHTVRFLSLCNGCGGHHVHTPEEIAESDLRVALIGEFIKARDEMGVSQRELERLSGVKQSVIARMESGHTGPRVDTLLKMLAAMGKTLAIVPLNKAGKV